MRRLFLLSAILFSFFTSSASASVVILGTRVIYPEGQKSINVQLTHKGKTPSLVQSWLDDGDIKSQPDTVKVPFLITPSIVRLDPTQGQTLRVVYTQEPLPSDRESLFFLNVLDIPAKPKAEGGKAQNYLQLAIRSRIKFFYRPKNLGISAADAYEKVRFSIQKQGGKSVLSVNNPTPYHITYNSINLKQGNKNVSVDNTDMVAPFSTVNYPLRSAVSANKVEWNVVNDFGGVQKGESAVQ